MHFSKLITSVALAVGVTATPSPATHVVHEKRHALVDAWIKRDAREPGSKLPMQVPLLSLIMLRVSPPIPKT